MTNPVFTHPGQPQMQAEVILASSTALSPPIYTVRGRLPRCIWPEALTHRVFGRNARSSRAVPVVKMLEEVRNTPFIPWHWGKNQRGMQAREECDEPLYVTTGDIEWNPMTREEAWKNAALEAADFAEAFMKAGYHKQIVNRLLEPFMWIDVLITSTDWDNFLWLRDHGDAEDHLQDWARLAGQALDSCNIQELSPGEWHLPYITDEDRRHPSDFKDGPLQLRRISAARCARISYKPFGSDAPDIVKDLHLFDKLVGNARIHASPMEHQAAPDTLSYTPILEAPGKAGFRREWDNQKLHGNLTGWIQHRKLIPGEHYVKDQAA